MDESCVNKNHFNKLWLSVSKLLLNDMTQYNNQAIILLSSLLDLNNVLTSSLFKKLLH